MKKRRSASPGEQPRALNPDGQIRGPVAVGAALAVVAVVGGSIYAFNSAQKANRERSAHIKANLANFRHVTSLNGNIFELDGGVRFYHSPISAADPIAEKKQRAQKISDGQKVISYEPLKVFGPKHHLWLGMVISTEPTSSSDRAAHTIWVDYTAAPHKAGVTGTVTEIHPRSLTGKTLAFRPDISAHVSTNDGSVQEGQVGNTPAIANAATAVQLSADKADQVLAMMAAH